ncbi:MAG TPA: PHB depolymerase family esterase, partial [Ktedonobacteraceae bacterium]
MNDHMHAAMVEATRLTRTGRLAEATTLIQRTLGGMSAPAGRSTRAAAPHEAVVRVVEVTPPLLEPTIQGGVGASPGPVPARPAVPPQTPSPDVLQLPGSLHGSMLRGHPLRPGVVSPSSHPGGKFVDGTYSNTAGTRSYKLYIPRSYTGQAVPLVIMLHGCTQNAVDFAAGTRRNIFAEG